MGVIENTIDRIKEMLVEGELQPGDRLPVERDFAAQLGVSRNSLREAVRALTTIGVVQVRQGDGTYVTSLAPHLLLDGLGFAADLHHGETVVQFLEVRRLLEPEATALAAGRISQAQLAELSGLLEDAEHLLRAGDIDHQQLIANDRRFHSIVAGASGNAVLAAIIENLSGQTTRARIWRGITQEGAAQRAVAEHRRIHTALVAGDGLRARLHATTHVLAVEDWLRQAW